MFESPITFTSLIEVTVGYSLRGFSLFAVEVSLDRSPSAQVTLGSVRGLTFSTVLTMLVLNIHITFTSFNPASSSGQNSDVNAHSYGRTLASARIPNLLQK